VAAAATLCVKEQCCLTHNLAGVGTISWPRAQDPPQGTTPLSPRPTARWNHDVAESAETEAYRGRECRLPGLPPVVRHTGPGQPLSRELDQSSGASQERRGSGEGREELCAIWGATGVRPWRRGRAAPSVAMY